MKTPQPERKRTSWISWAIIVAFMAVSAFGIVIYRNTVAVRQDEALVNRSYAIREKTQALLSMVKDMETGKVEITSMNHGFTVDSQTLPDGVMETHVSLFDGSNCGIRMTDRPVFSVQYHPEASPGPQDSFYLFERFAAAMAARAAT